MTRDQKNRVTEPSPGKHDSVFSWVSQAWQSEDLDNIFLPFPFGDSSDFNCCLEETPVADGLSIKMWSLPSKFAVSCCSRSFSGKLQTGDCQ